MKSFKIFEKVKFDTSDPVASVQNIANFLKAKKFDRIGVASFGPICLDKTSEAYGNITTTPKPHWAHFSLLRSLKQTLNWKESIGFDTDVNACALAEFSLG
jgi:fructokinase